MFRLGTPHGSSKKFKKCTKIEIAVRNFSGLMNYAIKNTVRKV